MLAGPRRRFFNQGPPDTCSATFFVDAVAVESGPIGGDLSNWNSAYRFALVNEITSDRPWLGDVHDVAIYNRAFDPQEVLTNFLAGADQTSIPPDEIPPAPMIIGIGQDTGVEDDDNVTGDKTLIFTGTAEPNSKVTLSEAALGPIGTATTDAAGDWTLDATGTPLADGNYRFTATAEDSGGNVSVESAPFTVEVDTAAPAAPLITAIDEDDGASGSDAVTSDDTLIFSGTAEPNSIVTLSEPGIGVLGTAAADETGKWIVDATSTPLADGTYSFFAMAQDKAGNVSDASTALIVEVVARHCVAADLTCNGFVDFDDLAVLLVNWNQDVTAAQGNLVDAANSPVDFDDLAVLLANWTGPAAAGAPHQIATAAGSAASDDNHIRATTEVFDRIGRTDSAHRTFLRAANRPAARQESLRLTPSPLRRIQAVAIDRAFDNSDTLDADALDRVTMASP